jgi:hypothetical protein
MRHRLSKPDAELAEISALVDRVRMPQYERIRAQAHLERAAAIAELLARAATAVRSVARKLVARPLHRAFERMA